ncbi:uncharacterized protein MICPUCDRAFT_40898 [Micromonas pusilla CCMP1545]|uniref:Predicted protein n=1 Tax=Micromonas pusilla (strain CCMP1545) TaxID=564608 RepID=C1MX53_MICPC|nr:uncharacterized protein MICPUCDRAFT_40898 [Micromonas pusilla CCMP1545]EEH55401.1 predicted protein [Micromonas pusilla CCMP1545]|eukprot:XP_003060632.1 predicted protein [Micromonas pusilla CCMP1545]
MPSPVSSASYAILDAARNASSDRAVERNSSRLIASFPGGGAEYMPIRSASFGALDAVAAAAAAAFRFLRSSSSSFSSLAFLALLAALKSSSTPSSATSSATGARAGALTGDISTASALFHRRFRHSSSALSTDAADRPARSSFSRSSSLASLVAPSSS